MARTNRPLRYGRKRSFKLREEDDAELEALAKEKNMKYGKLVRKILERSLRRRQGKDNVTKKEEKSKRYKRAQEEFLTQ